MASLLLQTSRLNTHRFLQGLPPASTALNHLLEGFVMLKMARCNTSMTKEGKVYALPHHDAIRAKRNDVWVPDPDGITLSTSNLRFTAFEKDHDHFRFVDCVS